MRLDFIWNAVGSSATSATTTHLSLVTVASIEEKSAKFAHDSPELSLVVTDDCCCWSNVAQPAVVDDAGADSVTSEEAQAAGVVSMATGIWSITTSELETQSVMEARII